MSSQAVRNWIAEGLKPEFVDPKDGAAYFDVPKLQAWREEHRPRGIGRGGKRAGAGNKMQKWRKTSVVSATGTVFDPEIIKDEPAEPAITEEQVRQAMEDPAAGGLKLSDARRVRETMLAAKVHQDILKARGEMVPVAEASAAWGRALTVLARAFDSLPGKLAPELVRVVMGYWDEIQNGNDTGDQATPAEMGQELSLRVLEVLVRGVDELRSAVAGDPLGVNAAAGSLNSEREVVARVG